MRVTLFATGTPAQVKNSIGHDVARERLNNQKAAALLYSARDYVAGYVSHAKEDETVTVSVNLEIAVEIKSGEGIAGIPLEYAAGEALASDVDE